MSLMQTNLSQNTRAEEVRHMEKTKQMYLTAREIAGILNMSVSYSYTIVAQLNMQGYESNKRSKDR